MQNSKVYRKDTGKMAETVYKEIGQKKRIADLAQMKTADLVKKVN